MTELRLKPEYSANPQVAAAILRIFEAAVLVEQRLKQHYTSLPFGESQTNAGTPCGEKIQGGFTKDK
jgi:hypothetical protein